VQNVRRNVSLKIMNHMEITNKKTKRRLPLFTPKKNGSGWDLNIGSRLSYVIVAIILAIPFAVVAYCIITIKK